LASGKTQQQHKTGLAATIQPELSQSLFKRDGSANHHCKSTQKNGKENEVVLTTNLNY